nr:hypothetical protein [Acidimicrobiia bacterium]
MAEPSFLQRVAGEAVDFFEFVMTLFGEPAAHRAIIKDLGGNPDAQPGTLVFPPAPLESIKAYRDAADPGAEAEAAVLADMLLLLDAIASNVELLGMGNVGASVEQLGQSLLDIMASNYVRLRFPRLFLILQAAAAIEDTTTTYGAGSNNLVRVGSSFATLFSFLFNPGKTLSQLESPRDPDLPADPGVPSLGFNERSVDGVLRLGAAVLGWMHANEKWKDISGDLLAGWDAPGLDVDSTTPPRKADVIANSMLSFSF